MRHIDMETWARKEHFKVFNSWTHPQFNLCANVDLTAFMPLVKQHNFSLNLAIVYVVTRTANAIPEFRYRIRDEHVVEHDVVHPSTTILAEDDLFTFCTLDYKQDFAEFVTEAEKLIAYLKSNPTLEDEPERDDMLFMTAVPWISFTSFTHPIDLNPVDSVPRFAWGKYFSEGESIKMPLSVQGHHALMDGVHVGKYYEQLQTLLNHPDFI